MPEDQKLNNLATNTLVLATLFSLGGLIVRQLPPLKAERPVASVEQLRAAASAQSIDARLWEDPFSVIAAKGAKAGTIEHSAKPYEQLGLAADKVTALWVMISGAPYFAEEEQRRRTRLAVVSALEVAGFVPDDARHLGFVAPREPAPRQTLIPFERFVSREASAVKPSVLVIWVDEDLLRDKSSNQLRLLAKSLGGPNAVIGPQNSGILQAMREDWPQKVGPQEEKLLAGVPFYSYGATAVESKNDDTRQPEVYRVLADDRAVSRALAAELQLRRVDPCHNRHQTIATISDFDTVYGRTLAETALDAIYRDCPYRKNNPNIGAIKKSYLRGLDGELAESTAKDRPNNKSATTSGGKDNEKDKAGDKDEENPFGLSQRDYLRRLADDLKRAEDERSKGAPGEGGGQKITAIGVLGNDVFDKLMILRALRPKFPEALFFTTDYDAALGLNKELDYTRNVIVGSSFGPVLRPGLQGDIPPFRDAYETSAFLATQIAMARLSEGAGSSPEGAERNIRQETVKKLVEGALQKEVQWPDVLATDPEWPPRPLIFEVTRSGDFLPLPLPPTGKKNETAPPPLSVQPRAEPLYPASAKWLWALALFCCVYAGASFVGAFNASTEADEAKKEERRATLRDGAFAALAVFPVLTLLISAIAWLQNVWFPLGIICGLVGVVGIIVAMWSFLSVSQRQKTFDAFLTMYWSATAFCISLSVVFLIIFWGQAVDLLTEHSKGEPMLALAGVSLWPVLALRLFALFLSIWLILLAFVLLQKNFNQLCRDFGLKALSWKPKEIIKNYLSNEKRYKWWPSWLNLAYFYRIAPISNSDDFEIDEFEWRRIVLNSWTPHRIARVFLFWMPTVLVFLSILFGIFGLPFNPARGNLMNELFMAISILDSVAMWFLVLIVVDATLFIGLFVWRLSHSQTKWPDPVRREFKIRLGLCGELMTNDQNHILDDWIDIQFIAKRTRCINSLVWYPFVIVSLMIISRSGLFANFPFSWPMSIAQGVALFLIFACAFGLNWFAEKQRDLAQSNLRNEITRNSDKDGGRAKLWENMLTRVNNLNEGSFRNFLQQPVFTGMLLPLASVGGVQFLEQAHLFGL